MQQILYDLLFIMVRHFAVNTLSFCAGKKEYRCCYAFSQTFQIGQLHFCQKQEPQYFPSLGELVLALYFYHLHNSTEPMDSQINISDLATQCYLNGCLIF